MKAIVLGGTGRVGHHIARCLHDAGQDVTICSRGLASGYDDWIPAEIPQIRADRNDTADMARIFETVYDIGKARRELGYRPRHTTEQAIRETARWASRRGTPSAH